MALPIRTPEEDFDFKLHMQWREGEVYCRSIQRGVSKTLKDAVIEVLSTFEEESDSDQYHQKESTQSRSFQ